MTSDDVKHIYGKTNIGVSGFILKDSKVLLGLRHPSCSLPNLWCTPGGKLAYREPIKVGLVREFKEETNLDIWVHELVTVEERIPDGEDKHSIVLFYLCTNRCTSEMVMAEREFVQLDYFSFEQLCEMFFQGKLTPATEAACMQYYAQYEGNKMV